jgi:uncharacterized protein (UPF0332 family)
MQFRGLLFSRGYKEKSHSSLKFAIKTLFVNYGVISNDIFLDCQNFKFWRRKNYVFAGFDSAMKSSEMGDHSCI